MKVLMVGLGSAGQRHMRNLIRILDGKVEFLAYRVRKFDRMFDDSLNVLAGQNVEKAYNIELHDTLETALKKKPDIAIIANPNSKHIDTAIKIASYGIDIFMEKPVSDSLLGVDELEEIIENKNIILQVGFQMRMHPCLNRLKECILNGDLGRIVAVECQMGELLTKMHGYEDYRDMAESKKELGGGVVLCQIHEIDYLYWLFGMPKSVYSIGGRYSDLDINVEDNSTTLCKYIGSHGEFSVTLHQDFLQSPPVRKCKVIGTNASAEVDLLENRFVTNKGNDVLEERFPNFKRNDMFIKEMEMFLSSVKTRKQEYLDLRDGSGSLKIALAIKESMETGSIVELTELI